MIVERDFRASRTHFSPIPDTYSDAADTTIPKTT